MQCLLEHGTVPQVQQLMQFLVDNANVLGRDLNGCSVIGKAMTTGLRADQVRVAKACHAVPGLLKAMGQSKHGHYVMKVILQTVREISDGEVASAGEVAKVQRSKGQTGPCQGRAATSGVIDKNRNRGKGGGKVAQEETEVRDLLESLRAACLRRSPVRITRGLQRVQQAFSKSILTPSLLMEAAQVCEQAQQILWALSMERGAIA